MTDVSEVGMESESLASSLAPVSRSRRRVKVTSRHVKPYSCVVRSSPRRDGDLARSLYIRLPQALLRLVGWRVGQKLKVSASAKGWTLQARGRSGAKWGQKSRKRSAMERLRSQRRWECALKNMRRTPQTYRRSL
jgi:hypothetical protein